MCGAVRVADKWLMLCCEAGLVMTFECELTTAGGEAHLRRARLAA